MEYLDRVDDQDNVIGKVSKEEAHEKLIKHRSAHILLFNEDNKVVSQFRSASKKIRPGCWTSSAAGHISFQEDPKSAAHRELLEEMGVEVNLEFIGKFSLMDEDDNEFVYVFLGKYDGEFIVSDEAEKIEYFDVDYLLNNEDLKLDPNFSKALEIYKKYINDK